MNLALAHRQLMTLPEQIAERIFAAIERGEYAPGERIREEAIAEQLEVSRGPVREALRILESDSVVRILPNRGAHVTQLSIKEVSDIFEIRRELVEPMMRGIAHQGAGFINRIEAEVQQLESLANGPDAGEAYLALSYALGRLLAEGCDNDRLGEIMSSLARQTRRYSRLGLATEARRQESARNWRAMADALKAHDLKRASTVMANLIDASRHEAIRQLQAVLSTPTKDIFQ